MEYSIQNMSQTKLEISLSVNKDEWNEQIKLAYEKMKHEIFIEGFRKGKVPMHIVTQRYGEEFFYEDALDLTLNKYFSEIVEKDKLDLVSRPDVDVKEVSADGVKAVITVIVRPTFTLGQYKGLDIEKDKVEVTEAEIKAVMDKEVEKRARLVDKDTEAVKGDTVVIDFCGNVDGKEFEGGKGEDYSLELGSNTFVPGFEDQLIGVKKGDNVDVNVTFPKDYAEGLASKDAVFAITVKNVQTKELPTIDDEFVKDIDEELNTVEEWKEKINKNLLENKEKEANYNLETKIMDKIVDNTVIEVPDCMVEEELDYRMEELSRSMSQYGLKFEDYLKYTGATVEQLRNEKKEEALRNIKFRLVMESIMKTEDLKLTAEEIEAEYNKLSEEQKQNNEARSYIANQLIVDKLFSFLKDNNNIL